MLNVDRTISEALIHEKIGQVREAEKKYLKVLKFFPENPRAKLGLQRLSTELKELEASSIEESLQKLIEIYNKGNFGTVIESSAGMLECDPGSPLIWNIMGAAQFELGFLKEAADSFEKVTALSPDYAAGHNNLGNVFQSQRKLKMAENCYLTALKLCPNYTVAQYNLAETSTKLGKIERALTLYTTALKLKPDYVRAYIQRNRLLIQLFSKTASRSKHFSQQNKELMFLLTANPLHLIYCAVNSFVLNDWEQCKAYLKNYDVTTATKETSKLKTKDQKFCYAYSGFLKLLLAVPKTGHHKNGSTAYHLGDSHCLSYANNFIRIRDQDFLISSKVIFGAKAFHFCKDSDNEFKALTQDNLRSIPKGSLVLLSFGEIDCRCDEGILIAAKKLECNIEQLVKETVTGFVTWFLKENRNSNHDYYFFNLPAPVYNKDLSQQSNSEVALTVKLFNETLESLMHTSSAKIINLYNLTSNNRGFSNGAFHCDITHLHGEVLDFLDI